MTIVFGAIALLVLWFVFGAIVDALNAKLNPKVESKPYTMGSANVQPGFYRKSKNW
jgi:hypothetical protein